MFCCSTKKRIKNKKRRNKIKPINNYDDDYIFDNVKKDSIVNDDLLYNNNMKRRNAVYNVDISDEKIKCGGCNQFFNLGSNELKIHCNLCSQFFHCKIAGNCQGENCMIKSKGPIIGNIHRASYCYDCVGLINDNKILCKDCFLDEHLANNL